jgi:signal transduction histidine kinase
MERAEDLIDSLKRGIEDAEQGRAEAERANQTKDLFLAMLGHELRTPLTSVFLQAQRLRRGPVIEAAKLARIGEAIERNAKIQVELLDDLDDAARFVAGGFKMEPRAVNLCTVVRAALDGVSEKAQRKSIRLEVVLDEVCFVAGDPERLERVVSNLVKNAIKVTPELGQVAIVVSTAGEYARIEVSDTGPGFHPASLPHVLNRTSHAHGGLGLGLAVVRHLVEQHDGTVEAGSPGPGKGTTFLVTLPLMKVA